jgi:two-component system response regulator NreC
LISEYRTHAQTSDSYDQLTPREREILKFIAEGQTSKEISSALFISLKTVMGHRTKLMEKLGIHNRTELIKYAMRKGLVSLEE